MGDLTEREIFDCLETSFREAREEAENLARSPRRGPHYKNFRDKIRLVEGACRQASYWREDTRWLDIAQWCGVVHKHCGEWLRGIKVKGGPRVKIAEGQLHPLFLRCAARLEAARLWTVELRDKATGHVGMILPTPLAGPHRDMRPVGWNRTPSGLILPAAAGMQ